MPTPGRGILCDICATFAVLARVTLTFPAVRRLAPVAQNDCEKESLHLVAETDLSGVVSGAVALCRVVVLSTEINVCNRRNSFRVEESAF